MEWTHRKRTIKIGSSGRFEVDDEEDTNGVGRHFDTLELAKKEVDNQEGVKAKERHADMALPVIDDDGRRHTVRGINRSHGRLQGIPERVTIFYPTTKVEELIVERRDLRKRVDEIDALLRPVRVPESSGYGRIRLEEYDSKIVNLTRAYDAAREAAEALI